MEIFCQKAFFSAINEFNLHNKALKPIEQIDDQAKIFKEVVKRAMAKLMKEIKVLRKSKCNWNEELRKKLEQVLEVKQETCQRKSSLT